jgi:DNA-binding FadR family transcriptional regulator
MSPKKKTEIAPIAKDLLYDKVSQAIIDYINRNNVEIGDKLPSERQFAIDFQVGRNSIRAGMQLLEDQGIVERKVGKGAFYKKSTGLATIKLNLTQPDFFELLEIKMNLEQLCIKKAFNMATDETIDGLIESAKKLQDEADKGIYSIKNDRKFHSQLVKASGNETLHNLILSLIDSLNCYHGILSEGSTSMWLKTVPFHIDIALALKARNLDLALAAHQFIYKYDLKVFEKVQLENK